MGAFLDSVLIVSNTNATLGIAADLLKAETFSRIAAAQSAGETRRILDDDGFDLIIIDTPLSDEYGDALALEAAESSEAAVVLLTDRELNADASERVEDAGVFVLTKPVSPDFFYAAVKLLNVSRKHVRALLSENRTLRNKLQEINIIDRAKYILIRYLNMTEPQAHRYIEKQSMDLRQSKLITAENVLKTYDNEAMFFIK
jgi:response regulator NasT